MDSNTAVIAAGAATAEDHASIAASLRLLDEHTRALADLAHALQPLAAVAPQAPALVAVVMDSFDDLMRQAYDKGIDVERGVLNGAEAALRLGATMDADTVRELDALLKSGVFAPATLRVVSELGQALTETAASAPAPLGVVGLLKALGQPDVQRALGFLVTFASRFGAHLRELPASQD